MLFGHKSLEVVGAGEEGLQSGPEGFRASLSIRGTWLLYAGLGECVYLFICFPLAGTPIKLKITKAQV